MSFIIGYAGHGAELFAMRSWIVPFFVFCLGSGAEVDLNATLLATMTSLVAVASSIGGAELALRVGRVRLITWVMLATFAISAGIGFSSLLPFAAVAILCLIYSASTSWPHSATRGAHRRSRQYVPGGPSRRNAGGAFNTGVQWSAGSAPAVVGWFSITPHRWRNDRVGLAFLSMGSMALLGFLFFTLQRRRLARGST